MAKSSKNGAKPAAAPKSAAPKSAASNGKKAAPAKVAARSEVRNSPMPKLASKLAATVAAPKVVTGDRIALRAYEIWASGSGGSDFDNWVRAERELRGGS